MCYCQNNDSTTCRVTTTNNEYIDYYNFITGEVGIQYVPTKIEIPKIKE